MYTYNDTLYKHNKTHFSDFDHLCFFILFVGLHIKSNN